MADEAIISTAEEIAGQVEEGSVASLEVETEDTPEVVPVRDLMALKDKNERLKNELKAEREARKQLEAQRQSDPDDDLSEFSEVDERFIAKITAKAKKEAIKEMEAREAERIKRETIERKLSTGIEQQVELARQNGVKLPDNVNKELLKSLALANPKTPINKLLEEMYGIEEPKGKATTENDVRPASDYSTEKVDVDSITPEELDRRWGDPKFRKAYLDAKYS